MKSIQMIRFGSVEIRAVVGPWLVIVLPDFVTLDLGSVIDDKGPLDEVKYRQGGEISIINYGNYITYIWKTWKLMHALLVEMVSSSQFVSSSSL